MQNEKRLNCMLSREKTFPPTPQKSKFNYHQPIEMEECTHVIITCYTHVTVPDWILVLGDVAVLGTLLLRVAGGVGLEPTLPRGLGATGGGLGRVGGGGFTRPPTTPPPTSSIFDVAVVFSFFSSLISKRKICTMQIPCQDVKHAWI